MMGCSWAEHCVNKGTYLMMTGCNYTIEVVNQTLG